MSKNITGPLRGAGGFPAPRVWLLQTLVLFVLHGAAWAQDPKVPRIGVIRSGPVAVFDRIQKGFEDGMASSGAKMSENIVYDVQNTGGDPEKALAIVKKFVAEKVDLIHSIGTPSTLAVVKTSTSVPVVFSAVTDPVSAGIVPPDSLPGKPTRTNVTGVTDFWPLHLQMEIYARIVPHTKKWGTIYNPTEINSMTQVKTMRVSAQKLGIELIEATVADSSEVRSAAASLIGKVKAIFIPADNSVTTSFKDLVEVCGDNNIALFTGGSGVSRGAVASYGIDYFLVGYAAGKKASLVLKGINPGDIPWSAADQFSLVINLKAAKAQGVAVPPVMLKMADRLIE